MENLESLTNHTAIGCGVVESIPHKKVAFRGCLSGFPVGFANLSVGTWNIPGSFFQPDENGACDAARFGPTIDQ